MLTTRNRLQKLIGVWILLFGVGSAIAQNGPTFNAGQDPKPNGKAWQKVNNMSDEFNNGFNSDKWIKNPTGNGWTWIGRAPGLFEEENVSVAGGALKVLTKKFSTPKTVNGKTWTHGGGIVRSKNAGEAGWYFECRMKANVTNMSSTFWLMTPPSDCNTVKKLELDIQECIGKTTSQTATWAQTWDQIYHSNMIERTSGCVQDAVQIQGSVAMPAKANSRYFVYGCWWKSPNEARFYLDGVYQYSVIPNVPFNEQMFLQMAIETYDWNPIPANETIFDTASADDRSTKYDWIRVWKLVDDTSCTDEVAFNPPTQIGQTTSHQIDVNYTACTNRDIIVEFWDNQWIASAKKTVSAGSGTTSLTVNLPSAPTVGSNYIWKVSIRPEGTTWTSNLDFEQVTNVAVVAQTPYGGTPWPLPGRIEAEDYDQGGEGIGYHDTDASNNGGAYRSQGVDLQTTGDANGDYNVGWMETGEWLEYTANFTVSQLYNFYIRAASNTGNGKFKILLDGNDVSGVKQVSNTGGWQTYQTITITDVNVSAGTHTVRIEVVESGMNLNFWSAWQGSGARFGVEENDLPVLSVNVYPVPLGEIKNLNIELQKSEAGDIQMQLVNVAGQIVWQQIRKDLKPGTHQITLSGEQIQGIRSGVYFLKVTSGKQTRLTRILF
ncbi:carbohydrate-binding protein [Limibacter armeniacum]|uniref:carbohydrate-binding protein n=1 Tax=Limibacter armeniacum TaxID=466084 RepID=UPI002FE5E0B4